MSNKIDMSTDGKGESMKKTLFLLPVGILFIIISVIGMVTINIQNSYTNDYYQDATSQIIILEKAFMDKSLEDEPAAGLQDNSEADVLPPMSVDPANDGEVNDGDVNDRDILAFSSYLYIDNTDICYPLVQGDDNKYYLDHLPNGKKSSSGSIFIDYQNRLAEDFNVIIYGHNMKDGTMFGQLKNFYGDKKFAQEHDRLVIFYEGCRYSYELFSVQRVEYDSEAYEINPADKALWINNQKLNSVVDSGSDPNTEDKFVTLSTCGKTDTEKVITIWKRLSEQ